jgi:hypothetical protein
MGFSVATAQIAYGAHDDLPGQVEHARLNEEHEGIVDGGGGFKPLPELRVFLLIPPAVL